jgi:hypothetical protein
MERIEIRPPTWKLALAVMGMIAFTIGGILILIYGDGVFEIAVGLLAVVFFGGFGGYALYRRGRGQRKLAILPTGLEFGIPGMIPRVVRWEDIEAVGVTTISKQKFTTVRIKPDRYQAFLKDVSPTEAKSAIRFFSSLRLVGYATVAVGIANLEDTSELTETLGGSGEVKTLSSMLMFNRVKFGAEFLLGWNMRDRSAEAFAEYLEQLRHETR